MLNQHVARSIVVMTGGLLGALSPVGLALLGLLVVFPGGAEASGPSGNTMKKFGSKRAHSTSRRLATRVSCFKRLTSV